MDSRTEWPTATVQYRLNLAQALHSISPALSALHTSRAVALHPEASAVLYPSHCTKCGTYQFSGDHSSYLVGPSPRKKRRSALSPHPKARQRRCLLCGTSVNALPSPAVPVQLPSNLSKVGTVPAVPQIREIRREMPPSDISCPTAEMAGTTNCAHVPPLPGQQSHPKPSHTKASTLKDMLARERQKEEVEKFHKKRKEGHEGLVAFLKEL